MNQDTPDDAVKPQVIDLEAEDLSAAEENSTAEPEDHPASPPPRRDSWWLYGGLGAAIILALLAGGIFYRSVLSAYLPSDAMQEMESRIAVLEAGNKTLGEQLTAVAATGDSIRSEIQGVSAAARQSDEKLVTLDERIAAFEKNLQELQTGFASLQQAPPSGTMDGGSAANLAQRLEAVEKDMASLKSGAVAVSGDNEAMATLSKAMSDLKSAIAAGSPYREQYDRIARLVPAAPGLELLSTHANLGLPGHQGLALELKEAIPSLPAPAQAEASASDGYWNKVWTTVGSVIKIRDIGAADWPALAENAASLAASGDLTQAIALIDNAEGDKPAQLARWRDRAAARLALESALGEVEQSVLRQIAATGQ
jgi:hypothetical protein